MALKYLSIFWSRNITGNKWQMIPSEVSLMF